MPTSSDIYLFPAAVTGDLSLDNIDMDHSILAGAHVGVLVGFDIQ